MTHFERLYLLSQYLIFIASVIYAGIALKQLFAIRRQAEIAKSTLTLTQRPRIKVRSFSTENEITEDQPLPSSDFTLTFEIVNYGGTDAIVTDSHCTIRVLPVDPDMVLSMWLPYERNSPHPLVEQGTRIKAGESLSPSPIGYNIPDDQEMGFYSKQLTLYVLGYLTYRGEISAHYRTAFCRRLQRREPVRFIKVDNPDYEYED